MNPDPYVDPLTGVLRNRLGATIAQDLHRREAAITRVNALELAANPIRGGFDLPHLQAIHRRLFADVYDWAGRLRTIEIVKLDTPENHYLPAAHIPFAAGNVFAELAGHRHLRGLRQDRFTDRIAALYGDVNYIHPFRDGNGRTQRLFLDQVAQQAGYRIDWAAIPPGRNDTASADGIRTGHHSALRDMLMPVIHTADPDPAPAPGTVGDRIRELRAD